ncbi:MAG: hypothetical protein OIF56_06955 [Cohaesibacter sp.]|nr:hypothetical protein [Cohaesibacter sp.]
MTKDHPASFGGFVASLLPLAGLVFVALVYLHITRSDMPLIGVLLLSFLSLLPLSIGPIFLMLVCYGLGQSGQMLALAIAFNRLRLKLVLPVFLFMTGWMLGWLPFLPLMVTILLAGAYFLACLFFTARLIQRYLELPMHWLCLSALGALCLAII